MYTVGSAANCVRLRCRASGCFFAFLQQKLVKSNRKKNQKKEKKILEEMKMVDRYTLIRDMFSKRGMTANLR